MRKEMDMFLTIVTPTYNRGELLLNLYTSLKNQTIKEFEWFIIDDGSIDNTKEIVERIQKESNISIQYSYQENAGKHKALNRIIPNIKSELTFIVDSDDYLEKNAVEEIKKYHEKYKQSKKLCGYSFLRKYPNGEINDKKFPKNELRGNFIEIRINKKIAGDKAEVWYTKCLQEFPFPEFENEKFIGEDIVWIDMALKYDMIHINEAIYISEYLEDGLTKTRRKHNINSPKGCMERAKRLMYKQCNYKTRIKGIVSYIVYGNFASESFGKMYTNVKNKMMFFLIYPMALILFYIWKHKYMRERL